MADEFLVFLAAGLLVLIALLVVFNVSALISTPVAALPVTKEESLAGSMPVGPADVNASRSYNFSLNASHVKDSRTYQLGTRDVYNGLFFGSNILRYTVDAPGIESMEIGFSVISSNHYAPLLITVNGAPVAERLFALGEHRLPVNGSLLKESTVIDLSTHSSGWRIWAPSLYTLDDLRFIVRQFSLNDAEFRFSLGDEIATLQSAKLDLVLDENIGALAVSLNTRVAHNSSLRNQQSITLDKALLRKENVLSFSAAQNSRFLGRGHLTVYYTTRNDSVAQSEFTIAFSRYAASERGRVLFNVVNVKSAGGMQVEIAADNVTLFSTVEKLQEQQYIFYVTRDHVRSGRNVLTVRSLANASFSIRDVTVEY